MGAVEDSGEEGGSDAAGDVGPDPLEGCDPGLKSP